MKKMLKAIIHRIGRFFHIYFGAGNHEWFAVHIGLVDLDGIAMLGRECKCGAYTFDVVSEAEINRAAKAKAEGVPVGGVEVLDVPRHYG